MRINLYHTRDNNILVTMCCSVRMDGIGGDVGLYGAMSVFWLKGCVSDVFSRDTWFRHKHRMCKCVGRKNEEKNKT